MALFVKREPQVPKDLPVSRVTSMRAQGLTNNQIIQTLQRDGFSSSQIFDALNQADMQPGSPPADSFQDAPPNPPPESDFQQGDSSFQQPPSPPVFSQEPSSPQQAHQSPTFQQSYDQQSNEELIEAIIEEKWTALVKDIGKILDWKTKTESRIVSLEQRFIDLKDTFDKLHEAIIGKIGEYDKNILEVGTEIKAMEKVFSKVLPVFTENINELSRITDKVKGKKLI